MMKNLVDLGGNALAMYYIIERFSTNRRCNLSNQELGRILKFGRPTILKTRKILTDNGFIKTIYARKKQKGYIRIEQRTKISELLENSHGN